MEGKTTGQKLLASLDASELVRRERYANTGATAKLNAVRDKLPGVQPKHPTSHLTTFSNVESEVHRLLPDTADKQPGMAGIRTMLASKADRHEAAWQQYVDSRELAKQQHDTAAAAVAAALKARLDGVDRDIEADMAVLAEDKVMILNDQQIAQVWESVSHRCATTASWIDGLAADLSAAEAALRLAVESALGAMVADMCDIAHLDEGRVQRLLEQEATTLNINLLDNRQVAADVLQQLHTHQVQLEQARRKRWEDAFDAWRTLHSRHALSCFCKHVQDDLAEPVARLELFAQLQDKQQEAHEQLTGLCKKVGQLQPPHLSSEAVHGWIQGVKQWDQAWQQQLAGLLAQLREQEDELEQQAQSGLSALRDEILNYNGYTAEEIEQLLQQEAQPVLTARREAAQKLLHQTTEFLERQAAEWQLATQVLSSWISSLVSLFEDHKVRTAKAEAGIKASLRVARQQFEQEDADREAALDAAVLSVGQGSSEAVLDERVAEALNILASVEAGYRAYAAAGTDMVRGYPAAVRQQSAIYMRCMCGLLHVQPHGAEAAEASANTQPHVQQLQPHVQHLQPAAEGARPLTQQSAQQQQQQQQQQLVLELPGGGMYKLLHELWGALWDATPKPWQKTMQDIFPDDSHPADTQLPASRPVSGAAAAAAAAAPAAPPASQAAAASVPGAKPAAPAGATGGKLTAKQQAAEVAAAAEAAALAAAAAAAEAAAAALAAANAPPPCPTALTGVHLCDELDVPGGVVQASLQQLQLSLLSEMDTFSSRSLGTADTWAESVEQMLTEELDARLRSHRPRAGCIEEEVRAARSVELLAQRRRVESHMRAQSKAVKQQAADMEEAVGQLRADAAAWRSKLLGYERLLCNAMSLKGIDIVWREAQALHVKEAKLLQEQVAELQERVGVSCAAVVAANRKFEADNLRSFEEGGKYAQENVTTYKAGISGIDHHMEKQQQQQQEQLTALQQQLSADLSAALSTIEQLLPSHKQDMTLIEALNRYVEGAKKKASSELAKNSQAGAAIDALLEQLEGSLAKADAQAAADVSKLEPLRQQKGEPEALQDCRQLLEHVSNLRHQLLRQAQALDMLQYTGLAHTAININLPTELQPLELPDFNSIPASNASATFADVPGAAAKGPGGRPGTGQKGRPGSSGASNARASSPTRQPQPGGGAAHATTAAAAAAAASLAAASGGQLAEAAAVPLAKPIRAVIDNTKQEVEAAAKAYYAAKGASRPIRYPARIAPSLMELMSGVDTVLAGLQQLLQEHMVAASKQLRVQAAQAHRLLERVPAAVLQLLTRHLLAASGQQHSRLLGEFAARRKLLEQQLEQHKTSLHPSMLHPNRRSELEGLKAAEAARQSAAADLCSLAATTCLALTTSHANQLSSGLADGVRLLLVLLDGCVMPADLVPAPAGDDLLAGMAQRSLATLQRLALAQEEAEPLGPAPAAAPSASSKGSSKPGKGSDADGEGAAAAPARRFQHVSWQLAVGSFALSSLGWLLEDQQAVVAAGRASSAATTPVQPAGQAAAGGAPAQKGSAGTAPTSSTQQLQQQQQQLQQEHPTEAGVIVVGYDTPCQRAVIRAQRAAILRIQQAMSVAVSTIKEDLYHWVGQEQQWGSAWARMIDELDLV